jgi:Predicted DNA modification methylase
MTYIYRLAGDDMKLAKAELQGFLKSQEIEEEPEVKKGVAITDSEPSQLRRLALVHEVSEVLDQGEGLYTDYRPENSFAVRSECGEEGIEEKVGAMLEKEGNSVDLEDPDEVIKVYRKGGEYIIGRLVEEIDRGLFEDRKNQNRPFSSPVSLDPGLARVLVNLSEVSLGEKLLDPFCGTGGILIEAGLCGVDVYGMDLQQEMVEGARENLEEYGIVNHDIRQGSIEEINEVFEENFDAIVTDLPYGQASKTEGEPAKEFLEKIDSFEGRKVFMYDEPGLNGREPDFKVYEHKNLTRYIYIVQ